MLLFDGGAEWMTFDMTDDARDWRINRLVPTAPVYGWLAALGPEQASGPVVLDLSDLVLHGPGVRALVAEVTARGARVVGLAGIDIEILGAEVTRLPPVLEAGSGKAGCVGAAPQGSRSLTVERGLRSGQSVRHGGDVTVLGAVASGAEVVAGGSIHVLGPLMGRAIVSEPSGRIFCRRLGAEMVSIAGVFAIAEEIEAAMTDKPAMIWLEGSGLRFAAI